MRRLIRRIVNWAFGYDFLLRSLFLEEGQRNLSIYLYDHIMSEQAKGVIIKKEDEK